MPVRNRVITLILLATVGCRIPVGKKAKDEAFNAGTGGQGPTLAIIGDSLSSGVLASTQLGAEPDRDLFNRFTRFMFGGSHKLDSIQGEFSELNRSATATDGDWGLRAAIGRRHGLGAGDVRLIIAAKWGGALPDLPTYLSHLQLNYAADKKPADYVVLMIGGNDYCQDSSPEKFYGGFVAALRRIVIIHPQATLLVSLLPPIPRIVRYEYSYSPVLSCESFRKIYCSPLYNPEAVDRILAYNDAIKRGVRSIQPSFAGKIVLATKMAGMELSQGDLSFDCFHPSEQGQRKFARLLGESLADL